METQVLFCSLYSNLAMLISFSKLRYGKEDLTKMKEEKQMTEESAEKHLKLFQELKEANSLAATQYQLALEKLQVDYQSFIKCL